MTRKLEKGSPKKMNIYYSENENNYFNWLKLRIGQKKSNKAQRILINFLIDREDIAVEFIKYAYEYLELDELVRVKNEKIDDEETERYKKIFYQQYKATCESSLDILIQNGILNIKNKED